VSSHSPSKLRATGGNSHTARDAGAPPAACNDAWPGAVIIRSGAPRTAGDDIPPGPSARDFGASWRCWHHPDYPVRIGVSSCLLGDAVRYDGGHKLDPFVARELGRWVEWVSVCPEVEVGLGVPRAAIRLEDHADGVHLVEPTSGADHTRAMTRYAARRVRALRREGLDGYVFKKGSPSCGPSHVRVYPEPSAARHTAREHARNSGTGPERPKKHPKQRPRPRRGGAGLFAAELARQCPTVAVEDESRLNDPAARDSFIERVFCANRWRVLTAHGCTRARLLTFHTAHRMQLLAHNKAGTRRMEHLVRQAGVLPGRELFACYEKELHRTLCTKSTPNRHANVLRLALGYFEKELSAPEKEEILRAIDGLRNGLVPLVVPLTLLRSTIRRFGQAYLGKQLYFDPHPEERILRNHV